MSQVRERHSLLANWRYVLATTNPPKGHVDPVSRWLVLTRAAVLPMTLTAALIAGLLGVNEPGFKWWLFGLASVGILLAHMANNLMNDLFDLDVGTDTSAYPRALYAPHPVLSGMVTRSRLTVAALLVNVLDLVILVVLFVERGWPVVAFALGGFFVSAAYTAPPRRVEGVRRPAPRRAPAQLADLARVVRALRLRAHPSRRAALRGRPGHRRRPQAVAPGVRLRCRSGRRGRGCGRGSRSCRSRP